MSEAKLQADLNSVAVTIEDLRRATDEVHKLAPKDRNWEGRLHTMARIFKGEPRKALVVEYRLVAMTRLLEARVLPAWALPEAPDGSVAVAEPVWAATAIEPLVFGEDDAHFEPKRFVERVLSLAEPEGNA